MTAPDADEVEWVQTATNAIHEADLAGVESYIGLARAALTALTPLRRAERERVQAEAFEEAVRECWRFGPRRQSTTTAWRPS